MHLNCTCIFVILMCFSSCLPKLLRSWKQELRNWLKRRKTTSVIISMRYNQWYLIITSKHIGILYIIITQIYFIFKWIYWLALSLSLSVLSSCQPVIQLSWSSWKILKRLLKNWEPATRNWLKGTNQSLWQRKTKWDSIGNCKLCPFLYYMYIELGLTCTCIG